MNYIKDINKRHLNGQDSRYLYIAKKTEKVVSAIFMVTDLFGDDIQKIKRTLQEESINILELVHELHAPAKFENTVLVNLEKKFTYIVSLLEVALHVQVISESNANILIKEIYGCIERIHAIKSSPLSELQQGTLTPSSFELPALVEAFEPNQENHHPSYTSPQSSFTSSKKTSSSQEKSQTAKKTVGQNSTPNTPQVKKTKKSDNTYSDKNKRQDTILGYLQKDTLMNIQDIYDYFEGISSKTIQRDLNELIKDNKVIREGNKRWATYKRS